MKTVKQAVKLPPCPKCGSHFYHFDNTTGLPTYCAECGINADHISEADKAKCIEIHQENVQKRLNDGVPVCRACGGQLWRFDLDTEGGPYITYCACCGSNYPEAHDPQAALTIISAQTGRTPEEIVKGDKIPINIKPNSLGVQNGSSFVPDQNRLGPVIVEEEETLEPVIENPEETTNPDGEQDSFDGEIDFDGDQDFEGDPDEFEEVDQD